MKSALDSKREGVMLFQPEGQIVIPGEGQNSQIGTVGSTPIVLEKTDDVLSVVTNNASALVPGETPEAVKETAERLVRFLESDHPDLSAANQS